MARVASIFARHEHMGQGIGKLTLNAVHDDIKAQNFPFIHLYACLNAVYFYRSQGYEKEESSMMKVAEGKYLSNERMNLSNKRMTRRIA